MLVRDILKLKGDGFVSIGPDAPIPQAVGVMVEKDIGALLVLEEGRMAGLVTFREVLAAVHRHHGDIHAVKVSDIMVRKPLIGDPEDTMDHLRAVMTENHARYVPVMKEGRLLGILSFHDIARAALKMINFENRLLKQYIKNWPEEGQS
ncbi:MAG TPA: CBS domain-containing protein [Burkholderiales bacterium]|nr:CBS domain-containing protein [Burkholderiales bacterium]